MTSEERLSIDVAVTCLRVRKYRSGERPETHEPFEVLEIDPRADPSALLTPSTPTEDDAPP